ncbi:MAG: hypothetical protein HY238_19130 [Acidobacteria bacterium]|nr:hypothetical protein [Acidobacteriota bacterium]
MFQHFEQARAGGWQAEWKFAGFLSVNGLWGTFRTHFVSLLSVFALYHLGGLHPSFYFLVGIVLHALVAWLIYGALRRLSLDPGPSFLAGALFLLLPTARNPLFWFPSCGQYALAAFWFLLYFHSVAGTVMEGRLRPRAAAVQALTLMLSLFSTDQIIGLLLGSAVWLALCWRSRAALASALLAWTTAAAAGGFYSRFINEAPIGDSVARRFGFHLVQLREHLFAIGPEYRSLLGFGEGFYQVRAIGWGFVATAAAGLLVWWWIRRDSGLRSAPGARFLALGAGLWFLGHGPVWLLQWSELRYHYLSSLGLTVFLAVGCFALLARSPRRLLPLGAALLAAYAAATTVAEIRQCWTPQAKNLAAIRRELRRLPNLHDHDIIAISGTPKRLGTAPHFAMTSSPYSSAPFAELVTGVPRLIVGEEIFCESGRLGLQQNRMRPLSIDDLPRTHVLVTGGDLDCSPRPVLACEVRPGAYELYWLKGYAGSPPIVPRTYTHDELAPLAGQVYFAHGHRR